MSKAVRWQVPFAAHDGTRYRVDIYDEGYTGNPVVLTAGETPFTTDEDDSDDFFAPVRTQTGTLQVCTDIEGSNTPLKLEDILPANNIARPVRLLKYANGSYSVIEWQGFLSCEAYSQDYIGIPQNLDLPLIGVLEAMDSINVNISTAGIKTVRAMISDVLAATTDALGISNTNCFNYILTSFYGYNVLDKYTPTTQFFSDKVVDSWTKRTHIIDYVSCKEILKRICVFMGWTVREQGYDLYFQRLQESVGMTKELYSDYINNSTKTNVALSQPELANLDWMGNGHQKSVTAGAKSVEVVAKLGEIETNIENPEYKEYDLTMSKSYLYSHDVAQGTSPSGDEAFEHGQVFDNNIDELATLYVYQAQQQYVYNGSWRWIAGVTAQSAPGHLIPHSIIGGANYTLNLYDTTKIIGSFYMRGVKWKTSEDQPDHHSDGVYISGFPGNSEILNWYNLFKMRSALPLFASNGQIKISMEGFGLARNRYVPVSSGGSTYYNSAERYGTILEAKDFTIYCKLKIGNKYYNGSTWGTTETAFEMQFTDEKAEKTINIASGLTGYVEFYVAQGCRTNRYLRYTSDGTNYEDRYYQIEDYFFSSISVRYESGDPEYGVRDVDENHYFADLKTAFRDEISIETDIASDLNNKRSISFLYDDAACTKRMQSIKYRTSIDSPSTGTNMRPEEDLLNRLSRHYRIPRTCLDLEAAHPSAAPLPLSEFSGINEDKKYLILSESRDWRTGVCKLKCFETFIPVAPPEPEPVGGNIDLTDPTYTLNGFRLDINNGEITNVSQGVSDAKLYIKQIIIESAGTISLTSSNAGSGIFLYYDYNVSDLILALETNDTEWLNDNITNLIGGASGASGTASLNVTASNYVLLYQGTVTAEFEE